MKFAATRSIKPKSMNKACLLISLMCTLGISPNCFGQNINQRTPQYSIAQPDLVIQSSQQELVDAFNWAKEKARFYVQTGKTGPLDAWERGPGSGNVPYLPTYWAGYPKRSAFYSRDFCHQLIGAHLLGLQEENFTMLKAFAASADAGKKWFPLWAINFNGAPFLLDYRGNDNFVREVPATFELVEKAYELYLWTGDERYLKDEVIWQYCSKAVTDFIALHDQQLPNGIAEGTGKGIFQGAASYNEAQDAPLIESGDGIACQFKAFEAYAEMAALRGETKLAKQFAKKAADLKAFFNQNWGINNTNTYNRGYTADGKAVDGWGKENSWFMLMKGITEGQQQRTQLYLDFIYQLLESKDDIPDNIEAISYIPETFFLHQQNERAWKWMKHIITRLNQQHSYQSATGRNGDYPEVSYVLIRNAVVDLLGIAPQASAHALSTLSHLPMEIDYVSLQNIRIGQSLVALKQEATHTSTLTLQAGDAPLTWHAGFPGVHQQAWVNGVKKTCRQGKDYLGRVYSYCSLMVKQGEEIRVTLTK
jgi:hypothetical protein